MTITGNKYYNQRRPSVSSRVTPELKEELLKLQKKNGGSLGDTIADVIQKGINGNNAVEKPTVPINDVKDGISDVDLNAVIDTSFNEGYAQCKIELKDEINGKLNGFKNSKKEKEFSCDGCGFEFDEKNKFCPSCGIEFDEVGVGGSDKKGFIDDIIDSINDIFSNIVGGGVSDDDDDDDDTSGKLKFVGGNKMVDTPNKEKEFSCNECGIEFDEKLKFCPGCGIELIY